MGTHGDSVHDLRRRLRDRIQKLEKIIGGLEEDVREQFMYDFIHTLISEYEDLISNECRQIAKKLGLHYMDENDVFQESIEYLIRWCLPASLKKSTDGQIWLPYLKRSIHNCYINLLKKSNTVSRKMNHVYIDDGEKGAAALRQYGIQNAIDLTNELRYRELIRIVAGELSPLERRIFLGILNPTKAILDFVDTMRKSEDLKRTNSKAELASYYGLSLKGFNAVLEEIRKTIRDNADRV